MEKILLRLQRFLNQRRVPPTLSPVDAYALWAENYPAEVHNKFMAIEQAAMLPLIPTLAGRTVLDLACGSGRYAQMALSQGASQVFGTDNSVPMLRQASGFPDCQSDMTALPFAAESFDVILCGLATGHLPPEALRTALSEMARVLHQNGSIVLSDFHPILYLNGGRRTFTAPDGRVYAVQHYPHLIADYFEAIRAAGLTLMMIREPLGTVNGRDLPAVLIIVCTKEIKKERYIQV